MKKPDNQIFYSASDLVGFMACTHLTVLDRQLLDAPQERTPDTEEAQLIKKAGIAHELRYAQHLQSLHPTFIDISKISTNFEERLKETQRAMESRAEIIYQGALQAGHFIGYADFLRRVPEPSKFGDYSYEVIDTKLVRSERAKFVIQLACYAWMLKEAQGTMPRKMVVVLGDQSEVSYRVSDYVHYFADLKDRFETLVANPPTTYPDPCSYCDSCHWRDRCDAQRLQDDHLWQVANINKSQILKLQAQGVNTLHKLAALPPNTPITKITASVMARLIQQARLQVQGAQQNKPLLELIPPDPLAGPTGFARMPEPNPHDLYFDMEGDPLEPGGLEYLFGLYYMDGTLGVFKPFWGHNRHEEKLAFEGFMDFVTGHIQKYPEAHIYHYAPYENTALKKLMTMHGTREGAMDDLLREHRLVDLYRVVREAIRVSEPSYSIKNIEHFYMAVRTGEVKSAGASIVTYEKWRETQDLQLLKEIEDYNKDDVISTYKLHHWLCGLRPATLPWAGDATAEVDEPTKSAQTQAWEDTLEEYYKKLVAPLSQDHAQWQEEEHFRELIHQLLDFYRRADRPQWWAYFDRRDHKSNEELLEDLDTIAECTQIPELSNKVEKKSLRFAYVYSEQETKLKTGDKVIEVKSGMPLSDFIHEPELCKITFKVGQAKAPLPHDIHIASAGPIDSSIMKKAVLRYVDQMTRCLQGEPDQYPAVTHFLKRHAPLIKDLTTGSAILPTQLTGEARMQTLIHAMSNLQNSTLFIQGPPGSGKTYTGAHLILALLKQGKRVGVASNSHKAIHKLLEEVDDLAQKNNFIYTGVKRCSADNPSTMYDSINFTNISDRKTAVQSPCQLLAGTAWLFADEALDQTIDTLFVDEAGQVAVANLIAMGLSAKNIILLGDQMQLAQPVQGVHPGDSGLSSLEYLLRGEPTIAPNKGVFLETTWRLHPKICEFISEAVYDGQLLPQANNVKRVLILNKTHDKALAPAGIRFVPVNHEGCSQSSEKEAKRVQELYNNLLTQHYQDAQGNIHPITTNNILVVAPYNMQVNLLKKILPASARVGTVDKFQGQEAEVVIVSMATSSAEYLPRNIEFLFSRNRLNVALSRARSLALLLANPLLTEVPCNTPEQMALVDILCWLRRDYGITA